MLSAWRESGWRQISAAAAEHSQILEKIPLDGKSPGTGKLPTSAQKASSVDDDGRARANGNRTAARGTRAGRSRHTAHPAMLKNRVLQVSMATNASMFTSMEDRALLDAAKGLTSCEKSAPGGVDSSGTS